MKKFLQILSPVCVIFGLCECQLSISGPNKTISSDLKHLPRQYCGSVSVDFTWGSPECNITYDITAQFQQGQGAMIPVPGYLGATYSVWSTNETANILVQSTSINGFQVMIGRGIYAGTESWTPPLGVLPAIPTQTTAAEVTFPFSTELLYYLEVGRANGC